MTRLVCPFCGPRELREFSFHKTLAADENANPYERTYERVADMALSNEHWQHVEGCRGWLLVQRNPVNGQVIKVRLLGAGAP